MTQPTGGTPDKGQPQDQLLDHEYDGIREYDNPMPRWWLATFWGAVVFAILYVLNVIPGVGIGKGRIAAYDAAVAKAQANAPKTDPLAGITDESLRALAADPAKHQLGVTVFQTNCVACHGPDGGGIIGPNLTDDYWLHGGRPTQILHTVSAGVLEKGMPAWGQVLAPDQVIAVAAYVTTLRGTHPKSPKPPQGVKDSTTAPTGR